jgi:chromosome segregation ATPase
MLGIEKELKELKEKVANYEKSYVQNLIKIVLLDEYIDALEEKVIKIESSIQQILLANKVLENNITKLQSTCNCKDEKLECTKLEISNQCSQIDISNKEYKEFINKLYKH